MRDRPRDVRGQSAVIGVALLLAITVVSVGVLTAGTGVLVDESARDADVQRVADRFATAYRPTTLSGSQRLGLTLTGGDLLTVSRTITVRRYGEVLLDLETAALRYDRGEDHVSVLGRAVTRGSAGTARFVRDPGLVRLFSGDGERVLTLSLVVLSGDIRTSVTETRRIHLDLTATHERRAPDRGRYSLAIETATPNPWRRHLSEIASSVHVVDIDGDGVPSVVAEFERATRVRLIVHHVAVATDG